VKVLGFGGGNKRTYQSRAVVTGAGSGIGRAFALELARRDGHVVCSDINAGRAQETVELINAGGGNAVAHTCDVSEQTQVEDLADAAEAWFDGPADLIINNAGVGIGGLPVGETPLEDWRWSLGVNLWGVVHGCHVFAPRLRELGRGGIVNVGSTASFAAAPGMGPYNVSKAAVLALSETLAAELSGSGIAVSVLCPTFVKTNVARDGRISGRSSDLANTLMKWTGVSADGVAKTTLDAHDRGRLYVIPQLDARLIWQLKRHAPVPYTRGLGLINRISGLNAPTPTAPLPSNLGG